MKIERYLEYQKGLYQTLKLFAMNPIPEDSMCNTCSPSPKGSPYSGTFDHSSDFSPDFRTLRILKLLDICNHLMYSCPLSPPLAALAT